MHSDPPTPVDYTIYSTIPAVTRFPGSTCSMWAMKKIVYTDFFGWKSITETRLPIEVSPEECRKMRDTRRCGGENMNPVGMNKWVHEGTPYVQGRWLGITHGSQLNCHLEEVTLQTECENCTISSPIGDIPGSMKGSLKHNLITLVWEDSWKQGFNCTVRRIESCRALLFKTQDPLVNRIRDSERQLDFIFNITKKTLCTSNPHAPKIRSMQVLGMENVIIDTYSTGSDHKEVINGTEGLKSILRAEIDAAAHIQYIRDVAVEMSNGLAKELQKLQCTTRKLAHRNAVATAQFNGWLAASYIDLPICNKLVAIGESVNVLTCSPMNVTFTTELTNCGPQPRYGNSTINVEGWELTRYSECYWHSNFVNFNGHAYTYKNETWVPTTANIVVQGQQLLITNHKFQVDNSLGTLLKLHPSLQSNPMSPAVVLAEIMASVQDHQTVDINGDRHISTLLIHSRDATNISFMSRMGNWMRNFGILASSLITAAVAFRFCGIGSLIAKYVPCLGFC